MPFSQEHADRACNFVEGILKHTGDYYGKPFILCPWEEELVCNLFGNLDNDGSRIIEMAYEEVPKKPIHIETPIRTTNGWKRLGDIRAGDLVFGEDGAPIEVSGTTEVFQGLECFAVKFVHGEPIIASADHEWLTTAHDSGIVAKRSTRAIAETLLNDGFPNHKIEWQGNATHIASVSPVSSVPVKCITVDSKSHLFLAGKGMIPTGNSGKTELAAGILIAILVLTEAPGCQAYGAASATRQAMNVYRAACSMVDQSKLLTRNLLIRRGTNRIMKRNDPDSFYAAVAADGDFGDGVNPSCVVADEVHRWKTRKQLENWDVLSKGGITRKQTLTLAITTAGVQSDSPLAWMLHEKTRKINEGIIPPDPRFFGRIYAADPSDDPGSPLTWIKANPSLIENGGFLDKQKIANEYEKAIGEGDLTSFKRYFLNIWDQKESRAIEIQKWDRGAGGWKAVGTTAKRDPAILKGELVEDKVLPLPHELLARFMGRRCWAGVDLSMTTDFTAVAFLFHCEPKDEEEEHHREEYDVLPFFWLPDAKLKKLEYKLGVPLARWGREGFLDICPGDTVDYQDVQARLEWGAEMFDLREVCWDPWNSRQISVPMVQKGFRCIEVRQGYQSLSEPTKKVLELVANNNLHHGGHPILRWNAGCACTTTDSRDNVMFAKPDRQQSSSRIDGLAAIVNAMFRAITDVKVKSVYAKRGLRFL